MQGSASPFSHYGTPFKSIIQWWWGSSDAFMARFNKKDTVKFMSFFGGIKGNDVYNDIAVLGPNEAVAVGYSNSWDSFSGLLTTTPGGSAYTDTTIYDTSGNPASGNPSNGVYKTYITKFDSTGNMTWSTFWGSPSATTECVGWGVEGDASGNTYVTGKDIGGFLNYISNPSGTYNQSSFSNTEAYLLAFNALNYPVWNTRFGGLNQESGLDLEFNSVKNVLTLCGTTNSRRESSPSFPIFNNPSLYPYPPSWMQLSLNNIPGSSTNDGYVAHFSTSAVVGIEEYFSDKITLDAFSIFPNPAQNEATLAFKNTLQGEVKLEIYNQLGQLIASSKINKVLEHSIITLNTSTLNQGMYLVNLIHSGQSCSKKLVISR